MNTVGDPTIDARSPWPRPRTCRPSARPRPSTPPATPSTGARSSWPTTSTCSRSPSCCGSSAPSSRRWDGPTPIGFLTEADRDRLNRVPPDIAPADLLACFTLSDAAAGVYPADAAPTPTAATRRVVRPASSGGARPAGPTAAGTRPCSRGARSARTQADRRRGRVTRCLLTPSAPAGSPHPAAPARCSAPAGARARRGAPPPPAPAPGRRPRCGTGPGPFRRRARAAQRRASGIPVRAASATCGSSWRPKPSARRVR
jgi:hypothetical protein